MELARFPVHRALTRPQMFAGVTYSYFVANAVLATELFLIFKTVWALVFALAFLAMWWCWPTQRVPTPVRLGGVIQPLMLRVSRRTNRPTVPM